MENRALLRPAVRLAGALLLAAAPSTAMAQAIAPAALGSLSLAKSEAILGETSALARMIASQRGITLKEQQPVQPASIRNIRALRAVVRPEHDVYELQRLSAGGVCHETADRCVLSLDV